MTKPIPFIPTKSLRAKSITRAKKKTGARKWTARTTNITTGNIIRMGGVVNGKINFKLETPFTKSPIKHKCIFCENDIMKGETCLMFRKRGNRSFLSSVNYHRNYTICLLCIPKFMDKLKSHKKEIKKIQDRRIIDNL